MQKANMLEKFIDSTTLRPTISAVASMMPFGIGVAASFVDGTIEQYVVRTRQGRLEYLIHCLESKDPELGEIGPIHLTEPIFQAIQLTIEATIRTGRREKISAFARLFEKGILKHPRIDFTLEFEDYLKILDDLSLREIQILYVLSTYEDKHHTKSGDLQEAYQAIIGYWDMFRNDAITHLQIPTNEIDGLLTRLSRSGLYDPIYSAGFGGPVTSVGKLTGTFWRLKDMLGENAEVFRTGHIVP